MAESEGEREERANTNNRGSEAKAKAAARYYFCGTLKKKVKSKVKFGSVGFLEKNGFARNTACVEIGDWGSALHVVGGD